MDGLLRMLPGSHRADMVQAELPRLEQGVQRSGTPVAPTITEAREMVLSLLWIVTLTAPLVALKLSDGRAALSKPVSKSRCFARG